jgi:hypothetical protein
MNHFLLNLDFCGTCHGQCLGCLLTPEERTVPEAFLTFEQVLPLMQQLAPEHQQPDYAALAFGRGNTLALSDATWQDIERISTAFLSIFKPKKHTIECSTGLVGKIQPLIAQAKKRVEQFGPDLRFVVAANSDLHSNAYWDNVDQFFQEMMAFRGGKTTENSGDVLVLNLVADRLPDLSTLLPRLSNYPFPVNVAWLPPTQNADLVQVAEWIKEFSIYAEKNQWDSNLKRFYFNRSNPTLAESLEQLSANFQNFWWIEKTGRLAPGLFTPMGDVDLTRLNEKTKSNFQFKNSMDVYKQFKKRAACAACPRFNSCLAEGTAALALFASNALNCPLGLNNR